MIENKTVSSDGCRILVVDDEEDVRVLLESLLTSKGHIVKTAANGGEAIGIIEREYFDIVLTDIRMPGTSGMDLTSWTKRTRPETDVIIMTGYGSMETAAEAVHLGAFDYLLKPFPTLELVASTIERAIEKKRMKAELQKMAIEKEKTAELRKAYDQLRETQYMLIQTEKLTALGELAAGVAHELNQPLNNIGIIMQSTVKDIEKDRYTISEIASNCKLVVDLIGKMAGIIDHMRAFTRKPEDRLRVNVDVNVSIENAVSLLQNQLRIHDIELEKKLNEALPAIFGDPNNLEQVILNLLTNARDVVLKRMGTDKRLSGKIAIRSFMLNDIELCVDVEDNGGGVPPPIRNRIFDPFFTTKEVGKGTGLGLSIAQRIITDYGGKIEVDFQEGAGTIFHVIMPVSKEDE